MWQKGLTPAAVERWPLHSYLRVLAGIRQWISSSTSLALHRKHQVGNISDGDEK